MIQMKHPVALGNLDLVKFQEAVKREFRRTSAVAILTSALKGLCKLSLIDLDLIVLTGVGPRLCNNHQLQPIFEKFISPRVRSFSILDPSLRPPIVHPLAAPQPYLAMQPPVRFWPVPMVSTTLQLCDARR